MQDPITFRIKNLASGFAKDIGLTVRDWTSTARNPKLPRWKKRKSLSSIYTNKRTKGRDTVAISWVALSTAILAVLAAIASLLSGEHANEAMMSQIEAADQWSYYQSKSIKAAVLDAKTAFTVRLTNRIKRSSRVTRKEQEEIRSEGTHTQAMAKSYFHKHEVFARGVTMFQIAIAIAAISALTRRRRFWIVSLLFGAGGCVFLVLAAITR